MAKLISPEQVQLSNGIPVILQHYDSTVAATYWWVKVGSADELPQEAGFAHFLEHMLFKDAAAKETGQASSGQMARKVESLGGDINAYTSFDQTVYHVTCAAHHWERVLQVFGTIAKPQRFLAEDFKREREVILEELRKNEDSPGRQLFQSLFTLTFSKHPYGRPVIGYEKVLKAAKLAQLESFYRRQYISGKMGLVLVGPIQDQSGKRKKAILNTLEKYFGHKVLKKTTPVLDRSINQKKLKNGIGLRTPEPPVREGANWEIKRFDVKSPVLSFSFRVPELEHDDVPALDLLAGVLGMGELSRLYQRLFYQTSLVTDVSGGLYVPKDPGMIYFQAEIDSIEKINLAAEEMFRVIQKLIAEGPTEEELARVRVNAESEKLYASQTADGMAGRLGFLKFTMGDLHFDQHYLDELRAVDSFKLKEVAQKYLDFRRLSGVVLLPQSDTQFNLSEVERLSSEILNSYHLNRNLVGNLLNDKFQTDVKMDSAFAVGTVRKSRTQSTRSNDGAGIGVEQFQLPSGIQVRFKQRSNSQVFSIHASVLGGLRLEIAHPIEKAETDWGSSHLLALSWNKGTVSQNAKQIAAITEGSAAGIDGFSGRNSIGLQLTGLARNWTVLSQLFTDVLLNPIFPENEVDHARRISEESIRGIEDHSSQLCSRLFLETLFQHHPYGKSTYGSLESIASIHSEKLKAFHRSWVRPERLVVSISGAISKGYVDSWLHQLEEKVQALSNNSHSIDLPRVLVSEPALNAPRWVERSLGREQCHILVGGLGAQMKDDDRFAMRLLQTLLGGQSGRLFIELRERKSLAYTVSPVSFEGLERGYIGTYIACAPQKRNEAIAGIQQVLEKLAEKGPTVQEMKRAKEFYLGRRAMDLQSDSALAAHFGLEALYQISHLSESELLKKVNSVGAKEIQKVCQKYLIQPSMVTSTVG